MDMQDVTSQIHGHLIEHEAVFEPSLKVFYRPVSDDEKAAFLNQAHVWKDGFEEKCQYLSKQLDGFIAEENDIEPINEKTLSAHTDRLVFELAAILLGHIPTIRHYENFREELQQIVQPV